jgi:hypothetical protein
MQILTSPYRGGMRRSQCSVKLCGDNCDVLDQGQTLPEPSGVATFPIV